MNHGFSNTRYAVDITQDGSFITVEPIEYRTKDGDRLRVRAGLKTDLASVPRIFWRIIPPFGKHSLPAILHDDLVTRLPWGKAAKLFLEAMESTGVPLWQRWAMYLAVRLWGVVRGK